MHERTRTYVRLDSVGEGKVESEWDLRRMEPGMGLIGLGLSPAYLLERIWLIGTVSLVSLVSTVWQISQA